MIKQRAVLKKGFFLLPLLVDKVRHRKTISPLVKAEMHNKNKDLKYDRKMVVLLPDEKSHKEHSLSKVFFNPCFFLTFVEFVPLIILEKYMTSSFGHMPNVQFSDQILFSEEVTGSNL